MNSWRLRAARSTNGGAAKEIYGFLHTIDRAPPKHRTRLFRTYAHPSLAFSRWVSYYIRVLLQKHLVNWDTSKHSVPAYPLKALPRHWKQKPKVQLHRQQIPPLSQSLISLKRELQGTINTHAHNPITRTGRPPSLSAESLENVGLFCNPLFFNIPVFTAYVIY